MTIWPGCKSVYLKDHKYDQVTCINDKCKVEFCLKRLAFRSPISNYRNHHHRHSCRYYENFTGNDLLMRDCTECRKSGKLLSQPLNNR